MCEQVRLRDTPDERLGRRPRAGSALGVQFAQGATVCCTTLRPIRTERTRRQDVWTLPSLRRVL